MSQCKNPSQGSDRTADHKLIPDSAIAADCRHYRGDRPCIHNRLCTGCGYYDPYSHRICIIKIGALGDVIRTLCILPKLREQYPNAHVTWVSKPNGCRMLSGHPLIDRLMPLDAMTALTLSQEAFDTVINLDKEPQPCALAGALKSTEKLGIGLSEYGTPIPLNTEAHDYFYLGLSDDLKFHRNTKSYSQLIYEALGWRYNGQRYELPVSDSARERLQYHLAARGWNRHKTTLGINVGAGHVFANKMWPAPKVVEVIRLIQQTDPHAQIVLLGGPDEQPIINAIQARLRTANPVCRVIDSGTNHDEPSFVALVDACDIVFCGDTMAMHVAIARGKHAVVFFGPTCEQEIDLFGRGEKLIAKLPCAPCYKRFCDQQNICVDQITPGDAADAIQRVLAKVHAVNPEPNHTPLRVAG